MKKITLACFVGGVITTIIALLVPPNLWWLGPIAGFCGGYLAYEFGAVLQAIPEALQAAKDDMSEAFQTRVGHVKEWLATPHPFFYPAAAIGLSLAVWEFSDEFPKLWQSLFYSDHHWALRIAIVPVMLEIVSFFAGLFTIILWLVIISVAFLGARFSERCYWWPFVHGDGLEADEEIAGELEKKGLHREPSTYRNVARWFLKGLGVIAMFLFWWMWKCVFLALAEIITACGRFAWNLVILIHSNKRTLCGLDGAIGGGASYLWLAHGSMTATEQLMLVLVGGLVGAALGVANYEIVSKRILHIVP